MEACPDARGFLVATSADEIYAVPAPCNRWDCPACGAYKRRTLYQRLKSHKGQRFMTLTCNPAAYTTPHAAYEAMSTAFSSLVKRIRRRYPARRFEYVLVWEQTKAGWPHLHVLLMGPWIEQRWLSRAWHQLVGAPIVDIRYVRQGVKTASYLSKYLTKALSAPRGFHRWRKSFAYFPTEKPESQSASSSAFSWRYMPTTSSAIENNLIPSHWHKATHYDGLITAHSPPHCPLALHNFYPACAIPQTTPVPAA